MSLTLGCNLKDHWKKELHAVFIMKTFIWIFAFMLFAQGISIIVASIKKVRS